MGANRELKFALENFWADRSNADQLEATGAELRAIMDLDWVSQGRIDLDTFRASEGPTQPLDADAPDETPG